MCSVDLRELGIGIVPYSPIGRGFFGGRGVTEQVSAQSSLVRTYPYNPLHLQVSILFICSLAYYSLCLSATTSEVFGRKS
jgi:hypothetical protein